MSRAKLSEKRVSQRGSEPSTKYEDIYCKTHDFFYIISPLRRYNNEKMLINQS